MQLQASNIDIKEYLFRAQWWFQKRIQHINRFLVMIEKFEEMDKQ